MMHTLRSFALFAAASLPTFASAQSLLDEIPGCDFQTGAIKASCIPIYIAYLIEQIFMLTGAICLIVIMVGGYQYALGQIVGGKEKAQATIRYGIIGMIVSALSFFIIDFIISSLAGI